MQVRGRRTRGGRALTGGTGADELLTVKQLADLSHESPETIRRRVRNGELEGIRLGGPQGRSIRIPRRVAEAYLAGALTADAVSQVTG